MGAWRAVLVLQMPCSLLSGSISMRLPGHNPAPPTPKRDGRISPDQRGSSKYRQQHGQPARKQGAKRTDSLQGSCRQDRPFPRGFVQERHRVIQLFLAEGRRAWPTYGNRSTSPLSYIRGLAGSKMGGTAEVVWKSSTQALQGLLPGKLLAPAILLVENWARSQRSQWSSGFCSAGSAPHPP